MAGLSGMGSLSVLASLVGEEGTMTRSMKSAWGSPHLGQTKVRDLIAIFRRSSGGQSSAPMAPAAEPQRQRKGVGKAPTKRRYVVRVPCLGPRLA